MIESGMLSEFIEHMIEQVNEDKLWQLYLATALLEDKSFGDWKEAALGSTPEQGTVAQETKPEEAVVHAEHILAGFKPF